MSYNVPRASLLGAFNPLAQIKEFPLIFSSIGRFLKGRVVHSRNFQKCETSIFLGRIFFMTA
jgi:hypothetical protein